MPLLIKRQRYPELDKLLWDIRCEAIDPALAFRVYEERWAFVQAEQLSQRERALIRRLTRTQGNGIFTPLVGAQKNAIL